jgi:NADPH-dependent curcumin reductase CurA
VAIVGEGEKRRKVESVKVVVDRSLDHKHALMEVSLQRLCPKGQSQQINIMEYHNDLKGST